MFVSERKLKANRENAQKSTGPKTAGGKAASSDITKTKINPAKRQKMQWGPQNNDKTNPNHIEAVSHTSTPGSSGVRGFFTCRTA